MTGKSRRSVLITGCSSGIGFVAAKELAARGYRVFATARHDADVETLRAEGLNALPLDLDDPASIPVALESILVQSGGELFALINNAAFAMPGAVEDLDRAALRAQFETNVFGTLDLTRRVIPVMRRQGHGRIVTISSILGLVAMPWRGAYNASKFALEGFIDTLRMELHGSGIFVSTINPGAIETRFRKNAIHAADSHVDLKASLHREQYTRMRRFAEDAAGRMPGSAPPAAVVRPIVHALEAARPRRRYFVTAGARVLYALKLLLPGAILDAVLRRL
ncbi:MAG TPA: SDR family NAD(P)-dependent oxidoreductase [Gammaproteobacteria bacterium]